jgi:hypothetical protein
MDQETRAPSSADPETVVVGAATESDLPAIVDVLNYAIVSSNATLTTQPTSVDERRDWLKRFSPTGPHRLLVARRGSHVPSMKGTGRTATQCDAVPSSGSPPQTMAGAILDGIPRPRPPAEASRPCSPATPWARQRWKPHPISGPWRLEGWLQGDSGGFPHGRRLARAPTLGSCDWTAT